MGASAALSGHSVGPLKTPKQGASSKHSQHTFRHGGNCCETDFGRHRISSKPVRNKWTSGLLLTRCTKRHDLETRKNQKDYYKTGINQVLLCDANDDYGKQLAKAYRIKHWKTMIRRIERTMIQKKEHRGTALIKLLILFDDAGNEGQDDTTIRQHSKKYQRGFFPNYLTSPRAGDTIKTLGCPLRNRISIMPSSCRNIKPRRAPGI